MITEMMMEMIKEMIKEMIMERKKGIAITAEEIIIGKLDKNIGMRKVELLRQMHNGHCKLRLAVRMEIASKSCNTRSVPECHLPIATRQEGRCTHSNSPPRERYTAWLAAKRAVGRAGHESGWYA